MTRTVFRRSIRSDICWAASKPPQNWVVGPKFPATGQSLPTFSGGAESAEQDDPDRWQSAGLPARALLGCHSRIRLQEHL